LVLGSLPHVTLLGGLSLHAFAMGSHYAAQIGLKLLGSSEPPM
jgi:hypothetical protein